jgi:hypothetical protein
MYKKCILLFFISLIIINCNQKKKNIQDIEIHNIDEVSVDNILDANDTKTQEIQNRVMYVNSLEGLRIRNAPNGEKTGLLDNLTKVIISKEDNNNVVIDDIDGKWVYITSPTEGWIFDGYLSEYKNIVGKEIVGIWRELDELFEYQFYDDYSFYYSGAGHGVFGTWKYEDGQIIIEFIGGSFMLPGHFFEDLEPREYKHDAYSIVYPVKYIDDDTLVLIEKNTNHQYPMYSRAGREILEFEKL